MNVLNKVMAICACLLLLFAIGCNNVENDPKSTAAPTSEPTATPEPTEVPMDAELISVYQGDWYGVFTLTELSGELKNGKGVANDCFVRFALQASGSGECYLALNGNGDGLFFESMATAGREFLTVTGTVSEGTLEFEFTPTADGGLKGSGSYVKGEDGFKAELVLRRPNDSWNSESVMPDTLLYTLTNGFALLIENMGGDPVNLPVVPEIEGVTAITID